MPGINFRSIILSVLEADERIWFQNEEGEKELNQTLLLDLVEKIDDKIINLLLQEEALREKFFAKISANPPRPASQSTPSQIKYGRDKSPQEGNILYVFKMNDFRFFMEENKIDNSYTAYKNRIGLTDGKKFLKDSNDIVLNWPYKDCILEGGQSNEEGTDTEVIMNDKLMNYELKKVKRKEIFFNSVLAPDEIDRLLDPKALVNWKRFDKNGEVSLTQKHSTPSPTVPPLKRGIDGTIAENMIIKGNNLIAMHSLKKQFAGKVKLIYIDPPYNTGNDGFKYNDNFNHSTWLTFMKNRLEVARELLREDGVIFVQCDDNEQAYLKVLMDEVFGRDCLVNTICIKMSHLSGVKMSHNDRKLPKIKEYIHTFSKKTNIKINPVFVNTNWKNVLDRYNSYLVVDENNPNDCLKWKVKPLNEAFLQNNINTEEEKNSFVLSNAKYIFRTARNKSKQIEELPNDNIFRKIKTPTGLEKYIYKKEEVLFASDKLENNYFVEPVGDIWSDIGINNLHNEGTIDFQLGKKPEKLIQRIIEMSTEKGDIVLDYHLGSGTTAAVAHKMGRQYIGIEQMDYVETIAVERLKKVIGQYNSPAKAGTTQEENSRKLTAKERQSLQDILEKIKNSNNSLG